MALPEADKVFEKQFGSDYLILGLKKSGSAKPKRRSGVWNVKLKPPERTEGRIVLSRLRRQLSVYNALIW